MCAYGALGLVLASVGASGEAASHASLAFMANVALALRRLNWATAVVWVSGRFDVAVDQRLVLASLCVASSPAAIMRVTHELRRSGQVTERLLYLRALNCLFAVLLLKGVVGYWHLETSGDLGKAAFNSLCVIGLSLVAGVVFGVVAPMLNRLSTGSQGTTVNFAFLVLLLTGVAQSLHLSPLLAALAFGLVARERRVALSHAQRNFGALGDVLAVFLFVFIGSLLSWSGLLAGLVLGVAVLAARSATHAVVNLSIARVAARRKPPLRLQPGARQTAGDRWPARAARCDRAAGHAAGFDTGRRSPSGRTLR